MARTTRPRHITAEGARSEHTLTPNKDGSTYQRQLWREYRKVTGRFVRAGCLLQCFDSLMMLMDSLVALQQFSGSHQSCEGVQDVGDVSVVSIV